MTPDVWVTWDSNESDAILDGLSVFHKMLLVIELRQSVASYRSTRQVGMKLVSGYAS